MKNIIIGITLSTIFLAACNSSNDKTDDNKIPKDSATKQPSVSNEQTKSMGSIKEIVNGYLQLKNALANDDGEGAASGGKAIMNAMQKFDKSSLTPEQKKSYDDMESAMKENAEHISENANKIDHQREHFDMLSQDMYDMVKAYGAGQTLYKDFCPMFNDKKGAIWISETKDIKNPYLGKKMPTCGQVKEEIK